jgi:putative transposase
MSQTSGFSRTGAIGILVHLLPKTELLDGEIFYSLAEARIVIESWRRQHNAERPHGSLGYKPPAPEVFVPAFAMRAALQPRPATPPALAERPTMN